ncbi:MAG: hypothetical protein J2P18_12405, partial [Nocardia sp.]|nr:hypothetical protein [Nocardia sp.]
MIEVGATGDEDYAGRAPARLIPGIDPHILVQAVQLDPILRPGTDFRTPVFGDRVVPAARRSAGHPPVVEEIDLVIGPFH